MGGLPNDLRHHRPCSRASGALHVLLVLLLLAAPLAAPAAARAAGDCAVASGDFCVCCPPSDCRREADTCPGGAGGLILLEAKNPACAVTPFDAARCKSGGVIASEMRSAIGVYSQGQNARIDLTQAQLAELAGQLSALGHAEGR